jgi:Zn-dependent protease
VILYEPERTQFDLNWRMFGIPVRVSPWFWFMSVVLGWSAIHRGISYLLLWVGCVFVSILVHELGHVFAGRYFGSDGHIVLHSLGGLAIGSSDLRSRWQRIVVYFAGPLAGFLLLGALAVGLFVFAPDLFAYHWINVQLQLGLTPDLDQLSGDPRILRRILAFPTLADRAIDNLIWINLFWGLLNLLPIWPLDGGQISRDFLDWLDPGKGLRTSLIISMLVAGILAVNSLAATYGKPLIPFLGMGDLFMTLLFAMFALQSYQLLQQLPAGRRRWDEDRDEPWQVDRGGYREQDPDWWKR